MSEGSFVEIGSAFSVGRESGEVLRVSRGARLPRLVGGPADLDRALRGLKIGVVGLGSIGRVAALHLARLPVDTIWLVDHGRYKPESLLTQAIAPSDVGWAKASSTGRACKAINPESRIFACDGPVQGLDPTAFEEAGLVLLATDNLAAEAEVAQRCIRLGRPLIQASVHGDTMTVQVRTLLHRDGSSPCAVCGYGQAEWAHMHRDTRFSCEGPAGMPAVPVATTAPTMSFSFLCSLAADLAVAQAVRLVLGLGTGFEDSLLEFCAYRHRVVTSPLSRNPECPVDHTVFRPIHTRGPLAKCTLRGLARDVDPTLSTSGGGLSFCVGGADFVELATCGCRRFHPVHRFLPEGADFQMCPQCGLAMRPLPFHTHRWVASAAIEALLDTPLADLTTPTPEWVLVRIHTGGFLVRGRGDGSGARSRVAEAAAEEGAGNATV